MNRGLLNKVAARLPLPTGGDYDRITAAARPFYNDSGPNSWEHIQDVYSQAARIADSLYGRKLTPTEYAAIAFHDSSCKADPSKRLHNVFGGRNAYRELAGILSERRRRIVRQAIRQHVQGGVESPRWSSSASDLLSAGDANPPDPIWMLNKSYNWQARHGYDRVNERVERAISGIGMKYGTRGTEPLPPAYRKYFGKRLTDAQKAIDAYARRPFDEVKAELIAYRKAHGALTPDSAHTEPSPVE